LRGSLRIAGFRVGWPFPEMPASAVTPACWGEGRGIVPCARAMWTEIRIARQVPTSSAVGDASRTARLRTSRAPSIGFSKTTPPSASAGVHSHELALASARRCQTSCSFRPRRSSRPRRFPPPAGPRACCIPQPTLGFTGFPRTDPACLRTSPRFLTDACPPELRPSREAVPASPRAVAPLPFVGDADATPRPCSARESVATTTRGRVAPPVALLGFPIRSPFRPCTLRHAR
jgi:hypothetical protein